MPANEFNILMCGVNRKERKGTGVTSGGCRNGATGIVSLHCLSGLWFMNSNVKDQQQRLERIQPQAAELHEGLGNETKLSSEEDTLQCAVLTEGIWENHKSAPKTDS